MKVCVPTRDDSGIEGIIEQHFGKAPTYTIMDTDTGEVYVIPNESNHMGGEILPPEYLHKNGVRIMICAGLGQKALLMFDSYRIQVFVGAKGTVKEALTAWKTGILKTATSENVCAGQGHEHECHH